jgi:hypothetical protein
LAAHRSLLVAGLSLVVVAGGLLTMPAVASADSDPVAEKASITFRLDPARRRIDAKGTFRFTNRIPVQRVGNRIRRIYLDRWGPIAIAADATGLKVRPSSVKLQRIPTGGAFDNLVFSFPRIYNGGSVGFTATWSVPGREGASTTGTVVSEAYSHFCWPGQPVDSGPITFVVPRALEAVTQGSPVRTTRAGAQRRITARGDLATFYACTDVYDPALLERRDLVSPRGHAVTVESLPGHDAWLDATSQGISEALAGVEAVVGAALPGDDPIRVREVPSGALQGYAGDFDPRSGVVRVGDQGASVALLSHELSHAWFNGETVADNWLWEGLAEWSSRETIGVPCDQSVERPFRGRPDLGDWKVILSSAASFEDQQLIQWQYEAACSIHGRVASAIGRERMQRVIALLLDGRSPYDLVAPDASGVDPAPSTSPIAPVATPSSPPRLPPGGTAPSAGPSTDVPATPAPGGTTASSGLTFSVTRSSGRRSRPVDWRQWLDIVDEGGLVAAGITDLGYAEDLLVETGVIRRRAVRGRTAARTAFHELRGLTPGGITPAIVRRDLDTWEFDAAGRDIELAREVAERIAALPSTDLAVTGLWADYEAATSRKDLSRLRARLP